MDRTLLNKATSYDDQPVTGVELNEIIRQTGLSFDASEQLVEYLLSKLKKDSPYVISETLGLFLMSIMY